MTIHSNATAIPINKDAPEQMMPDHAKKLFVFLRCNANMPRAIERALIKIEINGRKRKRKETNPITIEAILSGIALSSGVLPCKSPGEER